MAVPAVPVTIWVMGVLHRNARLSIIRAADLTREEKYYEARHEVQRAIRMNGAIASNPDAVSLYRIILAGASPGQIAEVQRVRETAVLWPPTEWEKMSVHPVIRVGIPLLWGAILLIRLVELSLRR